MIFGYVRERIDEENIDLQLEAINSFGIDELKVEEDLEGKNKYTILDNLFKRLMTNDVLVIYELDVLGKTMNGLYELAEQFSRERISLVVIKDQIDTRNSMGKNFLYLTCKLGEMERKVNIESTKIGLKTAREKGKTGGRPRMNTEDIQEILDYHNNDKLSVDDISEITGAGKSTIYKYIREDKKKKKDSN